MNADALLAEYFKGAALEIILIHSRAVAQFAQAVCSRLRLSANECQFVEEAALLHDIGVCRVNAPAIGGGGADPYILHGIRGREILDGHNLPKHGLVCERHIGVGLTVDDIICQGLPLPHRDMSPQYLLEEIICFADLFFSKKPAANGVMKSPDKVRRQLIQFGDEKARIFDLWMQRFYPL